MELLNGKRNRCKIAYDGWLEYGWFTNNLKQFLLMVFIYKKYLLQKLETCYCKNNYKISRFQDNYC